MTIKIYYKLIDRVLSSEFKSLELIIVQLTPKIFFSLVILFLRSSALLKISIEAP